MDTLPVWANSLVLDSNGNLRHTTTFSHVTVMEVYDGIIKIKKPRSLITKNKELLIYAVIIKIYKNGAFSELTRAQYRSLIIRQKSQSIITMQEGQIFLA